MFVYVSGPYTVRDPDLAADERAQLLADNVERADRAAIAVIAKGHRPFVPHTMMEGWEDLGRVGRDEVMDLCLAWVGKCDGLLYLGPSPGADRERAEAERLGLPVFESVDELPPNGDRSPVRLSESAIRVLLTEYGECAASYRHTYATIWQAGGILGAASAALLAFSQGWVQLIAPLPILAWYLALFLPMDAYGELRSRRLEEIEERLSAGVEGVDMRHFRRYESGRKGGPRTGDRPAHRPPWRVKHALALLMALLGIVQVGLGAHLLFLLLTNLVG